MPKLLAANERLRRHASELYTPALALSHARAQVHYFENRVVKHAMLVTAKGSPPGSTMRGMRMVSLSEFCERLREAKAEHRRCKKALDLRASQVKGRP